MVETELQLCLKIREQKAKLGLPCVYVVPLLRVRNRDMQGAVTKARAWILNQQKLQNKKFYFVWILSN